MKSSTYDDSSGMPATPEKALCGNVSAKDVSTPGPWGARKDTMLTHNCHTWVWETVVQNMDGVPACRAVGETREHAEANARLIAAAPALLEALTGLLRQCTFPTSGNDAFQDAVSKARDAVAPLVTPNTN
jgi:hypothetical protein